MPNGYDQDISRLRALVQFGPVSESKCNFQCRLKLAYFILLCGCVHHQQASTIYCIFPGFLLPRLRVGGACLGGSDKKSFHITRIGSRDEEEGGEYGARGRSRALLTEKRWWHTVRFFEVTLNEMVHPIRARQMIGKGQDNIWSKYEQLPTDRF